MNTMNKETAKQTGTEPEHFTVTLRRALELAMTKAGEAPGSVTMLNASLDRTWGDKDGLAFIGANAERAAKFASAWIQKNLAPRRSYDFQVNGAYEGTEEMVDSRSGTMIPVRTCWAPMGPVALCHVVATVYYPCAD
jgi:hypothetical protein